MICDTSGLIALADPDDRWHRAARNQYSHRSRVILPPFVLAELDHLLRRTLGPPAARQVVRSLADSNAEHAALSATEVARCVELDERYADLNLGLTDTSIIVLAQRYRTRDIFTLDERHFRAVRPLQGGAFRILPAHG